MITTCIVFAIFLSTCFLILFLVFKLSNVSVKRKLHYYLDCCKIEDQCLVFEREYYTYLKQDKLKEYPLIQEYLSQSSFILDNLGAFYEDIKFGKLSGENAQNLVLEIVKAPEDIRKLFFAQAAILENLFKARHPIKHIFLVFKKRTSLRILGFILGILVKKRENKKETEIKERIIEEEVRTFPLCA